MLKQIILFLTLSYFIVLRPVPSMGQMISQASVNVHMSMNNPTIPFQYNDLYHHTSTVAPMIHCGENQLHATRLHHAQHYLWTDARNVQDKQQAQINLNLSSSSANMTAEHLLNGRTITIDVGGQQLSVTSNTLLTPGEYMAVFQTVHSGYRQFY